MLMSSVNNFVGRSTAFTKLPYFEFADKLAQSPNDNRQHKLIRLPNNMIVLCTSDPDASAAAASLSVNVGSFIDPPELQGLAHLLEHAIHLGSTKYPGANEYRAYIQNNQGYTNAQTTSEETTYHFTIPFNAFAEALDRFSQLFISPLFDKDYIDKELQIIDSEFKANLQNPLEKEYSVIRCFFDPAHPASMNRCGNLKSLSSDTLDVREKVIELYRKYYSADIMKLAIVSNHSMDDLVEWTVAKFSSIKSLGDTRPNPLPSPYDNMCGKTIRYQKEADELTLYFPTPDINSLYKAGIEPYFKHAMEARHPGSLLDYLNKQNLATDLDAYIFKNNGYSIAMLVFSLTNTLEYTKVLNATLAYIALLNSPQEAFYREVKTAKDIAFQHFTKPDEHKWTYNMSHNSHNRFVDYKHYLVKDHICEYDENAIAGFMKNINNCFMICGTQTPKIHTSKAAQTIYLSNFSIDKEQITALLNNFELPRLNKYISESLSLLDGDYTKYPMLLEKTDTHELWFKGRYSSPHGCIMLRIYLPSNDNLIWHARAKIMESYIENVLEDIIGSGKLAGINVETGYVSDTICIKASGVSDKLTIIVADIIERLKGPNTQFKRSKQMAEDRLLERHAPIKQLRSEIYPHISITAVPLNSVLLENMPKVDAKMDIDISQCYIKLLVMGNFTESQARAIKIDCKPMSPLQRISKTRFNISPGHYINLRQNSDTTSVNNAVLVAIHCAVYSDIKQRMALELIGNMLNTHLYEELRTKQQLGYHIIAYTLQYGQTCVLFMEMQSELNPMFLTQRLNLALSRFNEYMNGMEVDEMARAAASIKSGNFNSNAEEETHFWRIMALGSYEFDIREKEAAALQNITKEYLLEIWDRYYSKSCTRIDLQSWVSPPTIDELEKYPEAIISLYKCLDAKGIAQYSLGDLQQLEDKWLVVHPSKLDPRINVAIESAAIGSTHLPQGHLRTPEGKIIIDNVEQFQAAQKVFDPPLLATTATPKY